MSAGREAVARLAAAGIEHPGREARWLGQDASGAQDFADRVGRRAGHEPLAYIVGHAPFLDFEVAVGPATLIPRADSETLIDAALAACSDRDLVRDVLDLGTGTGCLLLAALRAYPRSWGVGVDVVPQACTLARANAFRLGLAERCAMLCADWMAALDPVARFDLILCNPPYIPSAEIAGLMPEVARHEPRSALDGGADGLDAYRVLLGAIGAVLRPGGVAVFELGAGQGESVRHLAVAAGWTAGVLVDQGGHGRALTLCRRGCVGESGA